MRGCGCLVYENFRKMLFDFELIQKENYAEINRKIGLQDRRQKKMIIERCTYYSLVLTLINFV